MFAKSHAWLGSQGSWADPVGSLNIDCQPSDCSEEHHVSLAWMEHVSVELRKKIYGYSYIWHDTFTGEIQEDACKCLMLLIEIMDKGFGPCPTNDNINSKGSFSELLFSFVLGKYTICDICTIKSPAFETTSLLYVTPTDSSSMQELLMQEHKQKLYKTCSCCGRDTWHIESKNFLQPPNYLIIIVNRITYSNNRITKNKSRIPLDLYIKLGPYRFSLQASVDHHGYSMNSGHYTASINCCGKTFHCNDNKITECNITDTYNSSTAYILLYKLMLC